MAAEIDHDDPFQEILHQIGGKSNVHLVSAASGPDGDPVLKDFIADMFNNGEISVASTNGEIKTQTNMCNPEGCVQSSPKPPEKPLNRKTVSRNTGGQKRAMTCSLVIFIFTQDYVCDKTNQVCLREILKDVRARLRRNALPPALLGLVQSSGDRSESSDSLLILDRSLRSVFIGHPQQAIWTGRYVSKRPDLLQDIRLNACRAVRSSMSAESGAGSKSSLFWPLKCLPGIFRKGHRGQADFNTNNQQKANPNPAEEAIPLQMRAVAH